MILCETINIEIEIIIKKLYILYLSYFVILNNNLIFRILDYFIY